MKNKEAEQRFRGLLEQIKTRFELMTSSGNTHNDLDRDVLRDEIRELYRCLEQMQEPDKTEDPVILKEEPVKETPVVQVADEKIEEAEELIEEVKKEAKESDKRIEAFVANAEARSSATKVEDNSINSKLSEQMESPVSVVEKISTMPTAKITKIIGLNDKFQFINELFKGDEAAYNDCLKRIESMESFAEAETYLINETGTKLKWDPESELYKSLLSVASRYFA